jgi:hypothetical protein
MARAAISGSLAAISKFSSQLSLLASLPSQSSSMPLPGTSYAPGLTTASKSLQSPSATLKPS